MKNKITKSGRKVDTSDRKGDTSVSKGDTSSVKIPKRLNREELENLIMVICKNRYTKMEEVAGQIDRSLNYLKNKISPQMIRDGKLMKKYPYTENHPDQAYKTRI